MQKTTYLCAVSGKKIPSERVAALRMLGTPEHLWTCVEHSTTKPRKGVYLGEAGTSQILLVTEVYDDTVRTVFGSTNKSVDSEKDGDLSDDSHASPDKPYGTKELSYYTSTEDIADPEEHVQIVKRHEFA